jgi:glutamate dehydrogenase/leucine dehydrogenase
MEAALDHLGLGTLAGKSVALQGGGNVGASMIADLLERGASKITVAEVNPEQCRVLEEGFTGAPVGVRLVAPADTAILGERCDILSPNALGAILNPETIPNLACKIVCGAANNQLFDEKRDGDAIHSLGILYVPDFVANRMGIVSCANEEFGSLPGDPLVTRHFGREWDNSVYVITRRILESAKERGISTTRAAEELADRLALEPHPMFPGRGKDILAALSAEQWHERTSG